MSTITETDVLIPKDVMSFASTERVEEHLPGVLEMTRRLFGHCSRRLEIYLEDDPEIVNDRHIVFGVEVPSRDASLAFQARWSWCHHIFDYCPSASVHFFRIALKVID